MLALDELFARPSRAHVPCAARGRRRADPSRGRCPLHGRSVSSRCHRQDRPVAGYTLQRVRAVFRKFDAGTDDEIAHGRRHQYLAARRETRDPRADVHCHPRDVVALELDLAGVQARTHFDTERTRRGRDCLRARDRRRRARRTSRGSRRRTCSPRGRGNAGARGAPTRERVEELTPAAIAELGRTPGRVDDVDEENRREHAIDRRHSLRRVPREELLDQIDGCVLAAGRAAEVKVARELDEPARGCARRRTGPPRAARSDRHSGGSRASAR